MVTDDQKKKPKLDINDLRPMNTRPLETRVPSFALGGIELNQPGDITYMPPNADLKFLPDDMPALDISKGLSFWVHDCPKCNADVFGQILVDTAGSVGEMDIVDAVKLHNWLGKYIRWADDKPGLWVRDRSEPKEPTGG